MLNLPPVHIGPLSAEIRNLLSIFIHICADIHIVIKPHVSHFQQKSALDSTSPFPGFADIFDGWSLSDSYI